MRRRTLVALLLVLVFGAVLYAWLRGTSAASHAGAPSPPASLSAQVDRPLPDPERSDSQAPSRTSTGRAELPGTRGGQPPPGGRPSLAGPDQASAHNLLPRVAPEHYDAGLRSLPRSEDDLPNLVDKRPPGSAPIAPGALEALRYGLQSLDEDISDCLSQWPDLPGTDGGILIGFGMDATGLGRSWIQSDADIPFGPRTCFANAVYGIDWSHIANQPLEVTHWYPKKGTDVPATGK